MSCGAKLYENITIYNLFRNLIDYVTDAKRIGTILNLILKARRCSRCLKHLNQNEAYCLDCKFLSAHFNLMEQLYCQFQYDGLMKEMIHQYKFLKDYYLCELLAHLIEIPQTTYDYIVPIPSSPHDLSEHLEAVLKAKGFALIRF